ncbi:50S ribosomal protein L18 [Patescibacteria group bacterium]
MAKKLKKTIKGTVQRPRLSVFRSNRTIYAQIINDEKGETLVSVSGKDLKKNQKKDRVSATIIAGKVGELLAQKAIKKKIGKIVFDRGKHPYHGRIKALAEGARKKGLIF